MGKQRICPGCRARDARLAELQRRLAELEARLGANAVNSSLPPSAHPLDAPKPVVKEPTGRPSGGQPGHSPHLRRRLPPERRAHVIPLVPTRCDRCGAGRSEKPGPHDPEPTWHPFAELPPTAAVVTEFQGHARTCPCCGYVSRAAIPAAIRACTQGPRRTAALAYLAGSVQASQRGLAEIAETRCGVPLAVGRVTNRQQEVSAALAPAHAEAHPAVRQAEVKHAGETSWKLAGQLRGLWVAATATVAYFAALPGRGAAELWRLLGVKRPGILCSDRWSAYGSWPTRRRQVCWAHLKRDFRRLAERGGVAAVYGEKGLATVGILFPWWHACRGGTSSRAELRFELEPVRQTMRDWLGDGARCRDLKVARFCARLLELEPALGTFVEEEGVEPTNNQAERVSRRAVLWRKRSFGGSSASGCRFVERLRTVVQTLRLQKRSVLEYLTEAVTAYRHGLPAPKLLSES
jgi:transposase